MPRIGLGNNFLATFGAGLLATMPDEFRCDFEIKQKQRYVPSETMGVYDR